MTSYEQTPLIFFIVLRFLKAKKNSLKFDASCSALRHSVLIMPALSFLVYILLVYRLRADTCISCPLFPCEMVNDSHFS